MSTRDCEKYIERAEEALASEKYPEVDDQYKADGITPLECAESSLIEALNELKKLKENK